MRWLAPYLWLVLLPCLCLAQNVREFFHPQMGTMFRILVESEDSILAEKAVQMTFDSLDRLNEILSDYLPESEVNQLAQSAGQSQFMAVSDPLWEVIAWSQEVSRQSGGAFDVSIGPISQLWRRAFRRQTFPDSLELERSKGRVDYRKIVMDVESKNVRLTTSGMRLDFGGIAKGYAVDVMANMLLGMKIKRFLIDGGGDIYAGLPPKGKPSWEVVRADGKRLSLNKGAVATSGASYKYLSWKGDTYSHLIDPRTGLGVKHGLTVTVLAKSCAEADAWASALSILGPDLPLDLINYLKKKNIQFDFYKIDQQ